MLRKIGLLIVCCCGLLISCQSEQTEPVSSRAARRTNIVVGDDVLKGIDDTRNLSNLNGFISIAVDTLESPVSLDGLLLRNQAGMLEFSSDDGLTWDTVGTDSGSGGGTFGLVSDSHTATLASAAGTYSDFVQSDTVQIAAHVMLADQGTAQNLFSVSGTSYNCILMQFGIDAANTLFFRMMPTESDLGECNYVTYTGPIIPAALVGRMAEFALKADPAGNVVFYINGEPNTPQTMTAPLIQTLTLDTIGIDLFDGFRGIAASVKVGWGAFWPDTEFKGISREGLLFPGASLLFDFNQGDGPAIELLSGQMYSLGDGVSWVPIPGDF